MQSGKRKSNIRIPFQKGSSMKRGSLSSLCYEDHHKLYDYDPMIRCIGDNVSVVLIGEASHGTHDFYKERAEITKRLIKEKGVNIIALEADWPDAYRINKYVQNNGNDHSAEEALGNFQRFPRWMWRNTVMRDFVEWLREYNMKTQPKPKVGVYGMDLYSLQSSREAVIEYLDKVDPHSSQAARKCYSCFDHFGKTGHDYARGLATRITTSCKEEAVKILKDMNENSFIYVLKDGEEAQDYFFYAQQNARIVQNAEEYYRHMFEAPDETWNLRDKHMVSTLNRIMHHIDSKQQNPAKAVVWAHNSHLGDATYTSTHDVNIGQLVRENWSLSETYSIGFTTYDGSVTAADNWDGEPQYFKINKGRGNSYEGLMHQILKDMSPQVSKGFYLNFYCKNPKLSQEEKKQVVTSYETRELMNRGLLERAIGVIYRPRTELFSHYFEANLSSQFDAVIHIDRTYALEPLEISPQWKVGQEEDLPETFPLGE